MIVNGETLTMTRGDSESLTIKIKNPDKSIRPFTTGDIIELTVRKKPLTEKLIHKKVTTFETDGTATISIEPTDTKSLDFGKYIYDVQWTNSSGAVRTIIRPVKNNFIITEEVTY